MWSGHVVVSLRGSFQLPLLQNGPVMRLRSLSNLVDGWPTFPKLLAKDGWTDRQTRVMVL